MVLWCWVNFQCQFILLIGIIVGQGPIAPAVNVAGVVGTVFSLYSILSHNLGRSSGHHR